MVSYILIIVVALHFRCIVTFILIRTSRVRLDLTLYPAGEWPLVSTSDGSLAPIFISCSCFVLLQPLMCHDLPPPHEIVYLSLSLNFNPSDGQLQISVWEFLIYCRRFVTDVVCVVVLIIV